MPDKLAVQEVQTMIDGDSLAADTPFVVTTSDVKGLLRVKHCGQHHVFCVPDHADELKQKLLLCTRGSWREVLRHLGAFVAAPSKPPME